MRKKIKIMLVIVVLLFYSMNINALTRNEMISLNLKNVAKYPIGNSHVQGGVATDEYVISVLLNNNTNSNSLLVLNKDTFKRVNVGNSSYHLWLYHSQRNEEVNIAVQNHDHRIR